jgi:hypothetical protein
VGWAKTFGRTIEQIEQIKQIKQIEQIRQIEQINMFRIALAGLMDMAELLAVESARNERAVRAALGSWLGHPLSGADVELAPEAYATLGRHLGESRPVLRPMATIIRHLLALPPPCHGCPLRASDERPASDAIGPRLASACLMRHERSHDLGSHCRPRPIARVDSRVSGTRNEMIGQYV